MRTLSATHKLVTTHAVPVLVVALVATLLGGYYASKLTLESDLAELLPSTFESVRALDRIREEVGGVGNLRIAVEAPDLEIGKRFAEHVRPELLASPLVTNVDYRNDVAFYRHHALLYLQLAQLDSLYEAIDNTIQAEKQRLNPLFVDDLFGGEEEEASELEAWEDRYVGLEPTEYYTNDDSTVLVIQVAPSEVNTSLAFLRDMSDEVRRIVDTTNRQSFDSAIQVYYGGNIETRLSEYEALKKDILGTALYGLSGVFLLIVIYFRRITAAMLISVTLFASLCWTFGLTYLVIGSLNTITGFLFVILFGLGIDYGVHAFARYVESRRAGSSVSGATYNTICLTGKALATTAVTTAAAFFSLTLMDFKGFSDLGFIAGAGMLFALLAMLVVLPALITQAERFRLLRIVPTAVHAREKMRRPFRHARPILLSASAVTLLAMVAARFIDFEYDFTNLRMNTDERATFGEKTRGAFTLSESPAIVLADTDADIPAIVHAVEAIMDADTISPTVDVVRTVFSLVPREQPEKLKVIERLRELVETEAMDVVTGADKERLEELRQYLQVTEPFQWEDLPAKDRQQFLNTRGEVGNFVFIYPGVPLRDGKNAIEFRNDIGAITTAAGRTYHAASSNIVLADMLITMIREGRVAVLLTFAVVFLIVWADLRRLRAALFVLAPLVVGVLWMGGAMFVLGMKLNLFNIVVFPTVIGIGVDNGVHIYHRYKEEGPGSLYFVLRYTGLTITMTTLTTMIGYSGLILARHPGLNSIGNLALIGIGATYVTAIVVLPALLEFFEGGRQSGEPPPHAASASGGSGAAG